MKLDPSSAISTIRLYLDEGAAVRNKLGSEQAETIFRASELIAERLTQEAIALLKHTTWNVSEIAYSLGFEEPTHFNNFFKKRTRQTPTTYRTV